MNFILRELFKQRGKMFTEILGKFAFRDCRTFWLVKKNPTHSAKPK